MRQQVIATLGRFENLQASGQLERLLRSGARFSPISEFANLARTCAELSRGDFFALSCAPSAIPCFCAVSASRP
jgi:hypothetical protein